MPKGFNDARYRELIEQLIAQRRNLGWKQEDLAEKIGHHQQFVSRFETGERRLDAVEFADIARALGLKPGQIIDTVPLSDRT